MEDFTRLGCARSFVFRTLTPQSPCGYFVVVSKSGPKFSLSKTLGTSVRGGGGTRPPYTPRMPRFHPLARVALASTLISVLATQPAWGWGSDGHMMINRLAVQFLPADVPAFLRNGHALDTLEYLGPEPDRWRGKEEAELSATQAADHFIDLEWADLAGTPCTRGASGCDDAGITFPRKRYDFIAALATAQAKHPNLPLSPDKVGMQPWQVEEVWQRLKIDFREYRKLLAANQDTAPVKTAILFDSGWLGHYVADGSQPLHTTIQYNGWTGPNPHSYTTAHTIHSQFESVFVTANIKPTDVAPLVAASKPHVIDNEWDSYLDYLNHTHSLVEKVYDLEKAGGFTGVGTPEAKAFTEERLAAGAIELRDLIYSAWVHSADPVEEYHGPQ